MKKLSYQQVIHIKLWITFFIYFQKSHDISIYMYYNIIEDKEIHKRKELQRQ